MKKFTPTFEEFLNEAKLRKTLMNKKMIQDSCTYQKDWQSNFYLSSRFYVKADLITQLKSEITEIFNKVKDDKHFGPFEMTLNFTEFSPNKINYSMMDMNIKHNEFANKKDIFKSLTDGISNICKKHNLKMIIK